jgi:pimeloyl-ACP methyl ester carboxylesterase
MKTLKLPLLTLAALASASALAQPGPPLEELRDSLVPYASAADSVTLPDGRQVGFTCMGQGSPTVILIAGMGDFAGMAWGTVQPDMAKTTRVCAWDRPGWGLSDGAEGEHTVATSTAALEAALATGAISGPYVLVGHSLGGYESLLYADRHPDQVAGMVMVDPSFPDQMARIVSTGLPVPDPETGPPAQFRKCAAAIREGSVKLGGPDPDNCVTYPPFFPPALVQALGEKVGNPIQYETMASFLSTFAEDSTIVINPARNYGDMPLVVLTATASPPPPPDAPAERIAASAAWTVEWNRAHDDLAALSTRGVNARVPGADHYIQRSKPQVVIDAVEAVVAEVRAAAR